jgi:hypothetical protein
MLEFNAGIVGCELPIGFGVVFVAVFFPSRDFFDEGFPVGNAAVEALGQRDAEFGFGRPLTSLTKYWFWVISAGFLGVRGGCLVSTVLAKMRSFLAQATRASWGGSQRFSGVHTIRPRLDSITRRRIRRRHRGFPDAVTPTGNRAASS